MIYIRFALFSLVLTSTVLFSGCSTDDVITPDPGDDTARELVTFTTHSGEYLNNRFFKLDAPDEEPEGRESGDEIVPESIRVFRPSRTGIKFPGDINNVAAYVDSIGFGNWNALDFTQPEYIGIIWTPVLFETRVDADGIFEWIDIGESAADTDILAVVYSVINAAGEVTTVGDDPATMSPSQVVSGTNSTLYYRMKLLKSPFEDYSKHTFEYVVRNIYSLGSRNIRPEKFELKIEAKDLSLNYPEFNEYGEKYIKIFGLDTRSVNGEEGCDGLVDFGDINLFNLGDGWFRFPDTIPEPFNGTEQQYLWHCSGMHYDDWEGSYLRMNLAPELYNGTVLPAQFNHYSYFKIICSYARPEN